MAEIDDVKIACLDRAFELFQRTVRTSDPEEIVRYAVVFERYLRGEKETTNG